MKDYTKRSAFTIVISMEVAKALRSENALVFFGMKFVNNSQFIV